MESENGHHLVVEALLENPRVDPSSSSNYSIKLASRFGHHKVVELLLTDSRVNPSASLNYAIQYASYNGHQNIVELLNTRIDPSVGFMSMSDID